MKNLYVIVHHQKITIDVYHFRTRLRLLELPSNEELAEILGIVYEPDKDETMDIYTVRDIADLDKEGLILEDLYYTGA